jgi:dynein heavy chain 2
MFEIRSDSRVVSFADIRGVCDKLSSMIDQLDRCQKALSDFLEQKRSKFPRFYFIGDDDLLEILGQSQNATVIQVIDILRFSLYVLVFCVFGLVI